jgi:hypothetical protein
MALCLTDFAQVVGPTRAVPGSTGSPASRCLATAASLEERKGPGGVPWFRDENGRSGRTYAMPFT